jgi:hypothetical protein
MVHIVQTWLFHRLLWTVEHISVYVNYNRSGIPAYISHNQVGPLYHAGLITFPHVQDISQHFILKCTLFFALTVTWWMTIPSIQTLLGLRPSQYSCRRYGSSGMWHCVTESVVSSVLKIIFQIKQSVSLISNKHINTKKNDRNPLNFEWLLSFLWLQSSQQASVLRMREKWGFRNIWYLSLQQGSTADPCSIVINIKQYIG